MTRSKIVIVFYLLFSVVAVHFMICFSCLVLSVLGFILYSFQYVSQDFGIRYQIYSRNSRNKYVHNIHKLFVLLFLVLFTAHINIYLITNFSFPQYLIIRINNGEYVLFGTLWFYKDTVGILDLLYFNNTEYFLAN